MVGEDGEPAFSIKDAEGDQPEKLVFKNMNLEFPITSFEDKGDFYYAKVDKPMEAIKYAFAMFPKDFHLSYSNFYNLGFYDQYRDVMQYLPSYIYNPNYKIDIASVDETMNFSGKTLSNFYYNDAEGTPITAQRVGDLNLTINNDGKYDLTMTFDDFYTINTNGTEFTLSDAAKLSDDLEHLTDIIKENEPYDNHVEIDMILLGDKNIEELVGSSFFNIDDKASLDIYSSFGAVRK